MCFYVLFVYQTQNSFWHGSPSCTHLIMTMVRLLDIGYITLLGLILDLWGILNTKTNSWTPPTWGPLGTHQLVACICKTNSLTPPTWGPLGTHQLVACFLLCVMMDTSLICSYLYAPLNNQHKLLDPTNLRATWTPRTCGLLFCNDRDLQLLGNLLKERPWSENWAY